MQLPDSSHIGPGLLVTQDVSIHYLTLCASGMDLKQKTNFNFLLTKLQNDKPHKIMMTTKSFITELTLWQPHEQKHQLEQLV